jgi:hypothetical protein
MHPKSSSFSSLSPSSTGKPFYMVYAPGGSTAPRIEHEDIATAEAEAERLAAGINRPVFVMMAVSKFERLNPPVTKTELN